MKCNYELRERKIEKSSTGQGRNAMHARGVQRFGGGDFRRFTADFDEEKEARFQSVFTSESDQTPTVSGLVKCDRNLTEAIEDKREGGRGEGGVNENHRDISQKER